MGGPLDGNGGILPELIGRGGGGGGGGILLEISRGIGAGSNGPLHESVGEGGGSPSPSVRGGPVLEGEGGRGGRSGEQLPKLREGGGRSRGGDID